MLNRTGAVDLAAEPPVATADLDTRTAIHDLVVRFYREIALDELLGPLFDEVAEVDWARHIPKLIDYWCRVLLGEAGYDGLFVASHRRVHALEPFREELYIRWLELFVSAVDAEWSGPKAEQAKAHACHMASVLGRQLPVT
jgi:hemoglobin